MPTEPTAATEFWRFLGQVVTIVLGWIVVHKLSGTRDRDKARREMIAKSADSLSQAIDKLLVDARTYHLHQRDEDMEVQIKMLMQDISIQTVGLKAICDNSDELTACRSGLISLKQAITAKHFEDEHVEPLGSADQQIQDVAAGVLRAKQAFLRLKHCQFSSN